MTLETIKLIISLLAAVLIISGTYLKRHERLVLGQWLMRLGVMSLIIVIALWPRTH